MFFPSNKNQEFSQFCLCYSFIGLMFSLLVFKKKLSQKAPFPKNGEKIFSHMITRQVWPVYFLTG